MSRPHWSYSAVQQYLRCPLQYYFERVLRLPKPTVPSGLVLGSAVHRSLAYYHLGLQAGETVSIDRVMRAFAEAWHEQADSQQVQYKSGETRPEQLAVGMGLIEVYLHDPRPEGIVAVEQPLLVPLENSRGEILQRPLLAVLDLVTRAGDALKITELKTSGRSYSRFEVDTSQQATCYAHALHQQHGLLAAVEFAVLVKTKQPKLQRIGTCREQTDFERLGDLVEQVARSIDAWLFYPIESPLNCSGCPFREPCREWKPSRPSDTSESHHMNGAALC